MAGKNTARELLWPTDSNILLRVVFLYVGQGSSIIILAADGSSYRTLLADINMDKTNGGINVPALMVDLLNGAPLDAFINTHPHNDHLRGLDELSKSIKINAVWHTGFDPGEKHEGCYKALENLIVKIKKEKGNVLELRGSEKTYTIGKTQFYMLAPADYVKEEIDNATGDERDRRIHEYCAVLKFGVDDSWILITGDADKDAFEKHITKYHAERLAAVVLDAPHHGSRTFFRYDEEDAPYLTALETIDPTYVIISAPTQDESQHDHPHDDAIEFYAEHVNEENILHTGENRYCFICDIYKDEGFSGIIDDSGVLAENYPIDEDDGDNKKSVRYGNVHINTRVDDRGMG